MYTSNNYKYIYIQIILLFTHWHYNRISYVIYTPFSKLSVQQQRIYRIIIYLDDGSAVRCKEQTLTGIYLSTYTFCRSAVI